MPPAQLYVGKEIPSSVSSSKIYLHSNRQRLLAYYGRYPLEGRIVHGILAARLDAVPQAIECADSPPQLLVAFSGPPGPMNNGYTIGVLHNNRPERIRLNGIDCPEKRQA